jgi:HK97 family phage major capsid protein
MSRELRNLLADLEAKSEIAKALISKEDATADEIKAAKKEIEIVKAKIEAQKIVDEGRKFDDDGKEIIEVVPAPKKPSNYTKAFINTLLRRDTPEDRETIRNAMTSTGDADGGLLVPEDIQTAINFYKRDLSDLKALVNVVPVGTDAGSRVFEKIATMTPLANISDDTADIDEETSPQFEAVTYAIKKYAGWLPVPNDLLKDSDQNIIDYLANWIARKSVVTGNSLIIAQLDTKSKVAFADDKAIKKALNVTLDPALKAGAVILTNQDGFQYLDTLTDGNGRPLLNPDVANPTQYLFAGKPVVVASNAVLATTGTTTKKAPCIVGNFKEFITIFERQGYQVDSTNVGGTAFRKDRTEFRVIEREDVKIVDADAVIYGQVDVTDI